MKRKSYIVLNKDTGEELGTFKTYELAMAYAEDKIYHSYSIRTIETDTQKMWTEDEICSLLDGFWNKVEDDDLCLKRYGCSKQLLQRLNEILTYETIDY